MEAEVEKDTFPTTDHAGFRIIEQPGGVFIKAVTRCAGSILTENHTAGASADGWETVAQAIAEIDAAWAAFGEPCAKCR
jgi:hypothetical protein